MARTRDDDNSASRSSTRRGRAAAAADTEDSDVDDVEAYLNRMSLGGRKKSTTSKSKTPPRSASRKPRTDAAGRKYNIEDDDDVRQLTFTGTSKWPNLFNIGLTWGGEMLDDYAEDFIEYLMLSIPFVDEVDSQKFKVSIEFEEDAVTSDTIVITRPFMESAQIEAMPVNIYAAFNDFKEYHKGNKDNAVAHQLKASRITAVNNCTIALADTIDVTTGQPKLETYRFRLPKKDNGEQILAHASFWQKKKWNSAPISDESPSFRPAPALCDVDQNSYIYDEDEVYYQMINALHYRIPIIGNTRKHLHHVAKPRKSTSKKSRSKIQDAQDARAAMDRFTSTRSKSKNGSKKQSSDEESEEELEEESEEESEEELEEEKKVEKKKTEKKTEKKTKQSKKEGVNKIEEDDQMKDSGKLKTGDY